MQQHGDGTVMRRCTLLLIGLTVPAWAQASREEYRALYKTWRQVAPALEQDAASPNAAFATQLQSSTEAAQRFFDARAAYFPAMQTEAVEQSKWLGQPFTRADAQLNTPADVQQLLAVAGAKAATIIRGYATDDKDPAIRRVRQALDRERAALRALTETINANKASVAALIDLTDEAEIQRSAVSQAQASAMARRAQLAEHVRFEATDWARYYKDLADGSVNGGRVLSTANTTVPGPFATTTGSPNPTAPAKITRPATNVGGGQLPLSRYIGEWMFPNKGLFFGPQPEAVDLVARESNGQISGTLTARFARTASGAEVPALTLSFQGPMQAAITQSFPLRTNDGGIGTIELIPGSAFNLLEVNIQTESAQNKSGSANFMLVKR
jgi:hypothetical protein